MPFSNRMNPAREEAHFRLDRNEMPRSPKLSWQALQRCVGALNRYPVADNDALAQSISRAYGLDSDSFVVTHGIDDAIDRIIQLYVGRTFVLFSPTFDGFHERLHAYGVRSRLIYLTADFKIPHNAIDAISNDEVVIVASPNNPTGHVLPDYEIEQLLKRACAVILDETYIDFSRYTGWLERRSDRLFVFRSFSKSFGLAALRAGFLAGPNEEIRTLRSRQWFCSIDGIAACIICECLESGSWKEAVAEVVLERERVQAHLCGMGIDVKATEANFILVHDHTGEIRARLGAAQIRVREFDDTGMKNVLRITIGSTTENNALIRSLSYPKEASSRGKS